MENLSFGKTGICCLVAYISFTALYSSVVRTLAVEDSKRKGICSTPAIVEVFNVLQGALGLLGIVTAITSMKD